MQFLFSYRISFVYLRCCERTWKFYCKSYLRMKNRYVTRGGVICESNMNENKFKINKNIDTWQHHTVGVLVYGLCRGRRRRSSSRAEIVKERKRKPQFMFLHMKWIWMRQKSFFSVKEILKTLIEILLLWVSSSCCITYLVLLSASCNAVNNVNETKPNGAIEN